MRLKLRQLAVLQLSHFVELAFALQFHNVGAHALDFLFHMRAALNLGFFGFPDGFKIGILTLQRLDFVFNQRQAFFRGFIFFALDRFALDLQLNQAAVEFIHHLRLGIDFHLHARRGFVDQINRLVRQKTVGDITMRQLCCRNNRRIGNVHAMMQFVFFLQATQDGDCAFHTRLIH